MEVITFGPNEMTSKERVFAVVEHKACDRVPLVISQIDDLDYWTRFFEVDNEWDIRKILEIDIRKPRSGGIYFDKDDKSIWGVIGSKDAGYSDSCGVHPLADVETVAEVEKYNWPNPGMIDYDEIDRRLQAFGNDYTKTITIGWMPPFCILLDLFGMEEAMVNMQLSPEIVEACLERIEYFIIESTRKAMNLCAKKAEFFWCGDDFSTQRSMMISPEQWRKHFKPIYKKMFDLIKSYGLKVWFHSCGTFRPVLAELVDMGMDVWESVQFHLEGNDPAVLKREYGKYITFSGGICTQDVLPFGTTDDVRRQVRERIKVLGVNGGYICGPDHSISRNIAGENLVALFDEAKKCGIG